MVNKFKNEFLAFLRFDEFFNLHGIGSSIADHKTDFEFPRGVFRGEF